MSSCGSIFLSCQTVRIFGVSVTVKRNSTVQVEECFAFCCSGTASLHLKTVCRLFSYEI